MIGLYFERGLRDAERLARGLDLAFPSWSPSNIGSSTADVLVLTVLGEEVTQRASRLCLVEEGRFAVVDVGSR